MHEGLIILSKSGKNSTRRVLFSNKPIIKLFNSAIAAVDKRKIENLGHWLLDPKLFKPMKVNKKQKNAQENQQFLCLDDIITAQIDEPWQ